MRMAALNLAEEIKQLLDNRRTATSVVRDVNIKVHALSLVLSSIIAHYSEEKGQIIPALETVVKRLQIDVREAWQNKIAATKHTEEDTSKMLRKIGIIKKR